VLDFSIERESTFCLLFWVLKYFIMEMNNVHIHICRHVYVIYASGTSCPNTWVSTHARTHARTHPYRSNLYIGIFGSCVYLKVVGTP